MRQLPEQCASCDRQIATLETCVLPDGAQKRGFEVTFREGAEGGILCAACAKEDGQSERVPTLPVLLGSRPVGESPNQPEHDTRLRLR